ncbi:hypothetical protein D1867_00150 [Acidianus infernus]|uniref:C2H2-type domain-containing protein n=1 Tax=Acidianus infernus TaxID=12915 RepID=A0A6A9QEQ6_ACIIN|nr:C2H2-type zinc finger protein [Acidianus infernus]MUM63700.1 hypothetical protein [Acidianus infernus]
MGFNCPVCGKAFGSMTGLRKHFRKNHSNLDRCPVCNKKVNNLAKHVMRMKDEDHQVLWYLYNNLRGLRNKELKTRIRMIAKEKLSRGSTEVHFKSIIFSFSNNFAHFKF